MGLKRASSFMRVGPLLWLIHTLKEPCISTRPRSQMSPCRVEKREVHKVSVKPTSGPSGAFKDLVSSDGDLMHGVVDGLEKVQHSCQRPLQFRRTLTVCAVFEKLLRKKGAGRMSKNIKNLQFYIKSHLLFLFWTKSTSPSLNDGQKCTI